MSHRTVEQARIDLDAHLRPLADLMDAAHQEFQRECRGVAHKLDFRSRASIYRDLIVRNLRDYCNSYKHATVIRKGQLFLVGLENDWLLRVKRLRNGFSVAVSPTQASREYDANQLPASVTDLFPNHPAPTCVYLGWVVPENAPHRILKFLVCNDENRELAWALPLDEEEPAPVVRMGLPLTPTPPRNDRPLRVRVKGAPKRKANE